MINLIFSPGASPSSVPLGVSFLKAHIDSVLGLNKINILDLNIVYWNYLAERNQDYNRFLEFIKGKSGPFNRDFYEPLLPLQKSLKLESDSLIESLRMWLDKDLMNQDIFTIFNYLSGLIPISEDPILFSCLFPDQLTFTLGFSKWLYKERGNRIYIGGASVLLVKPRELLELAPWINGLFTGEGEHALEIFIRDGENAEIPGLYRQNINSEIIEKPFIIPEMDSLITPDFSWANLSSYFNPEPVLPVQFSRSCKWRRCRFCAHNFSFGKYRCMSSSGAVDMLENYNTNLGVMHFYITDQYLDSSFLLPFAKEIIKRNLVIRYTFMGRPAEDMTSELLELLAKSGCRWISWGVESGNQRLLDIAGKGTNPEVVSRVLRNSAKAGILNQALMIFGLPGSNDNAAEETYNFLQDNRSWIHSHTSSEFQLYVGTPFGNKPEKYGIKVTGKSLFCKINGKSLYSVKREHTDISSATEADILRGPLEARKWKRLGTWIYPDNFWNSLPSEHYLILSSREWDDSNTDNPIIEDKIS